MVRMKQLSKDPKGIAPGTKTLHWRLQHPRNEHIPGHARLKRVLVILLRVLETLEMVPHPVTMQDNEGVDHLLEEAEGDGQSS